MTKWSVKRRDPHTEMKKAPSPEGVTNDMLRYLGPTAKKTLLKIYKQSWRRGRVPSHWELAHIPILKKVKDKADTKNYRPISHLSYVEKLMERMINTRLL